MDRIVEWAIELQALAQTGLAYTKDHFDEERFIRIREIAAEMMSQKADCSLEKVKGLFCSGAGYPTPKIDTRAAIIEHEKILLVQERDGRWSLPGGWVDVEQSVGGNTVKEVQEEAGLNVIPLRVIAIQDRRLHNKPEYVYGVCKIFVLCKKLGGEFEPNIETIASDYFDLANLPPLAEEKTTEDQIKMCYAAAKDEKWKTLLD